MIDIAGEPRRAALRRLFPADVPNAAILESLFWGTSVGRILVDDEERPSWCVVNAGHYGFTFAGGDFAGAPLADAIEVLRGDRVVSLVVGEDTTWMSIGAPQPDGEIPRWEFGGAAAAADELARRGPDGCEVRILDAETFARCRWRTDMVETFGSPDRYLAESVGTCIVRDGEVVAEAHAAFLAPGVAEIGAITAVSDRGRGLAPVVVARLVTELAARSLSTVWSCDQENAASARVARKLGYARERPYLLLDYLRRRDGNAPRG